MILPVKFFWEQLDGPQVTGIMNAIYAYMKELLDDKLDYLNNLSVDTADDSHLTFLGILANFTRPIISIPDKDYFYITADPEHLSTQGLSSLDNRSVGGRLVGVEGVHTEAHAINTEHYRTLLRAYVNSEGEIGGLALLDAICYELSKLDIPEVTPFYRFEFMYGDIPGGRSEGDLYIDIGNLSDWHNPMHIYAVLRGLADSVYYPLPQVFISIDTSVTVPTPSADLPSGIYTDDITVTLTCSDTQARILYTMDGTPPNSDSNIYTSPITISKSTVLKVMGARNKYNNSKTATYNYTINKSE